MDILADIDVKDLVKDLFERFGDDEKESDRHYERSRAGAIISFWTLFIITNYAWIYITIWCLESSGTIHLGDMRDTVLIWDT